MQAVILVMARAFMYPKQSDGGLDGYTVRPTATPSIHNISFNSNSPSLITLMMYGGMYRIVVLKMNLIMAINNGIARAPLSLIDLTYVLEPFTVLNPPWY